MADLNDSVDWSDVAPGWDSHRAHVESQKTHVTATLLAQLALHGGERVLELGSGTGELARQLAVQVQPGGTLLASDYAEGMVDLIRDTVAGLDGVEVRRLDACDTGLPAASFDAVVIRMGLMLVPEPERALAEIRRLLAPGGRLGAAVWAGPEHNPWLTSLGMAAMMQGLVSGGPPTGPGGIFSLGDPADLEARVRAAGFGDVTVTEVEAPSTFESFDSYFDTVSSLAGPLSAALRGASPEQLAAVRATVADLVGQHETDHGLVMPGRALVCVAR